MFYLFNDTELFIDAMNSRITFSRGYWNYKEIDINFKESNEFNDSLRVFNELLDKRCIKSSEDEEVNNCLNQLTGLDLLYFRPEENNSSSRILVITDISNDIFSSLVDSSYNCQIENIKNIKKIIDDVSFDNLVQDPLKKEKYTKKLQLFLGDFDMIIVFLNSIDNNLCNIINGTMPENITCTYILKDIDFAYFFQTEKLKTGCYTCFSKQLDSRVVQKTKKSIENKLLSIDIINSNTMYMLSIMQFIIEQFNKNGITPYYGRLHTIYFQSFESRFESHKRLSFCPECGHVNRAFNNERNVILQNVFEAKEYDEH